MTVLSTQERSALSTPERSVARIITSAQTIEGGGFVVHRPFPTRMLADFDPFLLLDEMGPVELRPGEAKGAPDHPHRGFETVSYILDGELEHKDSQGNHGRLGPGDVQWMTAGDGVVHSEMPSAKLSRDGGRMHGFQLWVNLPAKDKRMRPRYQEVPSTSIPVGRSEDGRVTVRVIAGQALGAHAVIDTRTPILYLHYTLEPGARAVQAVPSEFNAFAYVIDGEGRFGRDGRRAVQRQAVLFSSDGEQVMVENPSPDRPLSLLLIAGQPLRETVARYGPFVMNTVEEIYQAFADYEAGRLGAIHF